MDAAAPEEDYRSPGDRVAQRRPLRAVVLAGPPRTLARSVAGLRAAAAAGAGASLVLPWHDVRTTGGGGFCWAPDCHGTSTLGAPTTCPSSAHVNPVAAPLVLLALVLAAAARWRTPRLLAAIGLGLLELGLLAGLFYAWFDLKHLFDRVTPRWGERLFVGGFLAMLATVALELVAAPLLYLWARARLPRLDAPRPESR